MDIDPPAGFEKNYEAVVAQAIEALKPGAVARLYKPNNVNHRICHIRAIVDGEYVVFRVWRAGRGWVYRIDSAYYFGLLLMDGSLVVEQKGKVSDG